MSIDDDEGNVISRHVEHDERSQEASFRAFLSAPQPCSSTTLNNPKTIIIEMHLITCRQKGERRISPLPLAKIALSEGNEGRLMRLDREDEINCNERAAGRQYVPHCQISVDGFAKVPEMHQKLLSDNAICLAGMPNR